MFERAPGNLDATPPIQEVTAIPPAPAAQVESIPDAPSKNALNDFLQKLPEQINEKKQLQKEREKSPNFAVVGRDQYFIEGGKQVLAVFPTKEQAEWVAREKNKKRNDPEITLAGEPNPPPFFVEKTTADATDEDRFEYFKRAA